MISTAGVSASLRFVELVGLWSNANNAFSSVAKLGQVRRCDPRGPTPSASEAL